MINLFEIILKMKYKLKFIIKHIVLFFQYNISTVSEGLCPINTNVVTLKIKRNDAMVSFEGSRTLVSKSSSSHTVHRLG